MQASVLPRAIAAARLIGSSLGLDVDDAVVLQNSNKLTLRLLPGDVLAQVAPIDQNAAALELDLAGRLAALGAPVAAPDRRIDPRVYDCDGFAVSFWTYYPINVGSALAPDRFGRALQQLHAGLRSIDVPVPRFTDRVESAQQLIDDPVRSPTLVRADRTLLSKTLRDFGATVVERGAPEQMLHGEPHPDNVLNTATGPVFIDFETCCRGPVEFDLAHAPVEVGAHYPGVDQDLLGECRLLMLAMVTSWRWDAADEFPDGRRLGVEWLGQLRSAVRLHRGHD